MAHKKAGGTASNLRNSPGQRLGVKKFGGESILAGGIIIRQRGTAYTAGENVRTGKDHTLFATADGFVDFKKKKLVKFDGRHVRRNIVSVIPVEEA